MRRVALVLAAAALGCGEGDQAAPDPRPVPEAPVPSFDCAGAEGSIQDLICSDPGLAALDVRLDSVYRAAVAVAGGFGDPEPALAELRTYQRGWIGGRDECWKAEDPRACVVEAYRDRIAELQAGYVLVEPGEPVFWFCRDNLADEFATTRFPTDPPALRVERGDRVEVFLQRPAASGARYEGPFGLSFWEKGDEAVIAWPQGTEQTCRRRDTGTP